MLWAKALSKSKKANTLPEAQNPVNTTSFFQSHWILPGKIQGNVDLKMCTAPQRQKSSFSKSA